MSGPVLTALGYIDDHTNASLQIGELHLLVVPGQLRLTVQFDIDIAFRRLRRQHIILDLNYCPFDMVKAAVGRCGRRDRNGKQDRAKP